MQQPNAEDMLKQLEKQYETENNDPYLRRCEEEHSKVQAMVQSSKLSLWASLLTINGFFIAFTLNNNLWFPEIHLMFLILFIVPLFILLWLFYYDRLSKKEFIKACELVTKIRRLELNSQDATSSKYEAANQNQKAGRIKRTLDTTGESLEHAAIIIMGIAIFGILFMNVFLMI